MCLVEAAAYVIAYSFRARELKLSENGLTCVKGSDFGILFILKAVEIHKRVAVGESICELCVLLDRGGRNYLFYLEDTHSKF